MKKSDVYELHRLLFMLNYIKRIIDIIISLLAIIIFLPLFFLIYFFIKINFKNAVFFKQKRMGKNGKGFYIYKIKTIEDDGPTKIGGFLRETFLDELPQFFNVLKGDMSLVGPRPVVFEEKKYYTKKELEKRLSVRPGLTGLWQVSPYVDKPIYSHLECDFDYIDNWSLCLDFIVIFKTIILLSKQFRNEVKKYFR